MSGAEPVIGRVRLSFIGSVDSLAAQERIKSVHAVLGTSGALVSDSDDTYHVDLITDLEDYQIMGGLSAVFSERSGHTVVAAPNLTRDAHDHPARHFVITSSDLGCNR